MLLASLTASLLIGWANIFFYQDRAALAGDLPFDSSALVAAPVTYLLTPAVYWLFGGLPVAVLAVALVGSGEVPRRRALLLLALLAFVPVLPAWWANSFFGPWYVAGLVAIASGLLGAAVLVMGAILSRVLPPKPVQAGSPSGTG